jgi:phosphomevalonate kinase
MAPGKLVLTGAYAVLDGAPAIVAAIDRYAVAEVLPEAPGETPLPQADVRALHDETGRKLGLGSSAAAVVASLGAQALTRGSDPRSASVRERIFRAARGDHARIHGGGSGIDVAASVYGGVSRYAIDANGDATVRALDLPPQIHLAAYDSGSSARTSDLLARFDRLRHRTGASRVVTTLGDLAAQASSAAEASDGPSFVRLAREFGSALAALGHALDTPIVPPRFAELASLAEREDAAFLPSGAGGGDVAVWLGLGPPSTAFALRAEGLSMRLLALGIDRGGLRPESQSF